MLSQKDNERYTRVGKGTPMGELMRRYWHPIAGTSQMMGEDPTMAVRLLGEDLVLYRTPDNEFGLIEQRCAHRGVDLLYGIPEKEGIRCCYHGWLYDFSGQCLEQPSEPTGSTYKDKIKLTAFPVQGVARAHLGHTWGRSPRPCSPAGMSSRGRPNVTRRIQASTLPCQLAAVRRQRARPRRTSEHLHGYYGTWINAQKGQGEEWANRLPQRAKHHLKLGFERFEHGVIKRRVTAGIDETHPDWQTGHPIVFPYTLKIGGGEGAHRFLLRVPIDDEHTWYVRYTTTVHPAGTDVPVQEFGSIPVEEHPLYDEKGRLVSTDVPGQDQMTWVAQGRIVDRTRENLGATDAGIILFRKVMEENLRIVGRRQGPDEHVPRPRAERVRPAAQRSSPVPRLRRTRRALVRSGSAHAGRRGVAPLAKPIYRGDRCMRENPVLIWSIVGDRQHSELGRPQLGSHIRRQLFLLAKGGGSLG